MQKAVSVKGKDYRNHFLYMSKDEAVNLLRNADLTEKEWNFIKHKNLLPHIKMDKEIMFGDIEIEKHKFH